MWLLDGTFMDDIFDTAEWTKIPILVRDVTSDYDILVIYHNKQKKLLESMHELCELHALYSTDHPKYIKVYSCIKSLLF